MIFLKCSKTIKFARNYVLYSKELMNMSYDDFNKKIDKMKKDPVVASMVREMVKSFKVIFRNI